MKEDNELPYIDKSIFFSAELRRIRNEREKLKKERKGKKTVRLKKQEKIDIYNKTKGICHICGSKLSESKFSITSSLTNEISVETSLPACKDCKRFYDNYLPDEIKWMIKLGMWAKTQVEFETDLGKTIALDITEQEKYRESKRKKPRKPYEIDTSKYPVQFNPVIGSKKVEFKTIKEVLYWSYANLSMAYKGLNDKSENYGRLHYIIRKKLFNGLMTGKMNVRSMFHDEKSKLEADKCCVYCGKTRMLQIDHIIARNKGGKDAGENLVWACRKCNASKNDNDLMEWYHKKNEFPPMQVLRNYMKLVIQYCVENDLMEKDIDTSCEINLPFSIEHIPLNFPQPNLLIKRFEINKD